MKWQCPVPQNYHFSPDDQQWWTIGPRWVLGCTGIPWFGQTMANPYIVKSRITLNSFWLEPSRTITQSQARTKGCRTATLPQHCMAHGWQEKLCRTQLVLLSCLYMYWFALFIHSRQKILKLEREWGYRWTYKCGHVSSWTIHFEWPCKVLAISSRFSPWAWLSGIAFYRLIPRTTHAEKRWQLISAHFWQINSFLCTCACGRFTQVLTLLFGWLILLNSREDSIDIIYGYQNGLQLKNDQFCRSIVLTWSDPYIPIPSHPTCPI